MVLGSYHIEHDTTPGALTVPARTPDYGRPPSPSARDCRDRADGAPVAAKLFGRSGPPADSGREGPREACRRGPTLRIRAWRSARSGTRVRDAASRAHLIRWLD